MTTTFADLVDRMRGHDARLARNEQDITAIISTVSETHDTVRWLERAMKVLLDHHGLTVPDEASDDG